MEIPATMAVAAVYISGQIVVAAMTAYLNYRLTKPHLERTERKADIVAVKVAEVADAVNGATITKVADAHAQGVIEGVAAEKANPT